MNNSASSHVYDEKAVKKEGNMEIIIDDEVESLEDAEKLGVQVGDFISFDPKTVVSEGGTIKSRFLDDKASAAVLLAVLKYLKENDVKTKYKLHFIFTVYEEVGHGGSASIPEGVTEMISVDMGCVGDDLTCTEKMVSICAKDGGGPYNYDVTTKLMRIAKEQNLDFAVDIYPHYGSDVETTLRAGYELRHGLIGPGVYASHNYERTHRNGLENTLKLMLGYIQD
ncbi:MAG: M20/M25/M40 family metallo-hydrolase, partial [Oscillospiraceae bacterium]